MAHPLIKNNKWKMYPALLTPPPPDVENSTLFFNSFNPSLIQFFLEIFNGLPYDIRLDLHYLYLPQSKVRILAKFILYILPSNLSKSPYNYSENKL